MGYPGNPIAEQRQSIAFGAVFTRPARMLPRHNGVFGMRHHAQNSPTRIAYTSNTKVRAIRICGITSCWLVMFIKIAECDLTGIAKAEGGKTTVTVQNSQGAPETGAAARRIIGEVSAALR